MILASTAGVSEQGMLVTIMDDDDDDDDDNAYAIVRNLLAAHLLMV